MASTEVAPGHSAGNGVKQEPVVNNFSIQVATVNGSGSQSANAVLMRTVFLMGVPVSGKNLFPSNIAGLPTWFTIRVSKDGYVAKKRDSEILVAMNAETAAEDVAKLKPGSVVVYDEPLKLGALRTDVEFFAIPFDKLVAPVAPEPKLRKLLRNMIYVGVLGHLLHLEMTALETAISKQFHGKKRATEINVAAARAGYEYAAANFQPVRYCVQPMNENAGKIIIDGNAAGAIGTLFGGVTFISWYPITPSSSLIEDLMDLLKEHRRAPDGTPSFGVVQAEDELAAIGMVLGASWAGARAMTATAGPGISLMGEFTGLGYYAEIPAVVWNVQRVGPSTGLPTRTQQADLLSTAFLSHGDAKHPMLLPCSMKECFEFGWRAFDVAERLQTPVFVLSDLDLGMNNWVSEPFEYPLDKLDRGKVLSKEDLDRLGGFARYKDVDGDGIGWRTLPGTPHPNAAWFARGSGHNERALYSERPEDYVNNMDRLNHKWETARDVVPAPVLEHTTPGAKVGIIAFGSSHWAAVEAVDQLAKQGIATDYLRLRAYPFHKTVAEFIATHDRVYVVEQNRDAQMLQLLKMDVNAVEVVKLRSVLHYDGHPLEAETITSSIAKQEAK